MIIILRDNTWRYPNLGFWAVHLASAAALGFLAYKAADCKCEVDFQENRAFPDRMPQSKEPQENQF